MFQNNVSMPNPVLGISGDFKQGEFEVSFDIVANNEKRVYVFENLNVKITNEFIFKLYESKKADFIFKISCVPTYKSWTYTNPSIVELNENDVDIILDIESFLIANCPIYDYSDESFSDDFENQVFQIEQGDIIAMTGSKRVPIQKENEKASIGSIFRFSKIVPNAVNKEIYFDFDEDQIVVHYPAEGEFDPVTYLFDKTQGVPYTALNLFIIPALTEAFRIMGEPDEASFDDKKWYMVLDNLLPRSQREEDCFINAQKVIFDGIPVLKSFNEILALKGI